MREAKDGWHVHTGKFSPQTENKRLLQNVNFDFTEQENSVFRLRALILSGIFYNIPGKQPLIVDIASADPQEILAAHLEEAHDDEKRAIGEIFSDPYLRLMGAIE